jgi:hypothetical protein
MGCGQAVVSETHDFYRMEADACMQSLDVPAYLAHVQRRLDEENERIIHYLDAATRKANRPPRPTGAWQSVRPRQ